MKIFELYNPNMKREDFDLADDLIFFMRNDPKFYRQDYHPFMQKFNRHCDAGRQVSTKAFIPIVKHAFECYKNTLSNQDLEEVCEKLQTEEHNFYHEEKKKKTEKKDEIKTTF